MKKLLSAGVILAALILPHTASWAAGDTTATIRLRPLPSEKTCLPKADTVDHSGQLPPRPCPPPKAIPTSNNGGTDPISQSANVPTIPIPRGAAVVTETPAGPTGCVLRPGNPMDCTKEPGR